MANEHKKLDLPIVITLEDNTDESTKEIADIFSINQSTFCGYWINTEKLVKIQHVMQNRVSAIKNWGKKFASHQTTGCKQP